MIIKASVQQINNGQATIKLPGEINIILPLDKLPPEITEGTAIIMEISTEEEHDKKSSQQAKDTLNELLDITP